MKKQSLILDSARAGVAIGLLAACLLLSACGQKGPLYLPLPAKGASSASSGSNAKNTP